VPQGEVPLTLSIGAVMAVAGERSASEMLAAADVGLYKAKDSGRNRTVFCEKSWSEMLDGTLTHHDRCVQCGEEESSRCVVPVSVN